ncbi:MAG: hypothetical protein F6J96_05745 [Symploca sp. SIO1C2]|nr:hypothetical protein [Symploca sp. SIO1C2]
MKIRVVATSMVVGLAWVMVNYKPVQASTITFEVDLDVPGYMPQDELEISDQFASTFGVTFGLDTDGDGFTDPGAFPILEQTGTYPGDQATFVTLVGSDIKTDTAKPGFEEQLGQFFLKSLDFRNNKALNLIINYSDPVAGASGEIWDIDGSPLNPHLHDEWWKIEALGQDYASGLDANNVVDTIISPRGIPPANPNTLDGLPWLWSFDRDVADIHAIRISSIGQAPAGFAFNNFSPFLPATTDIPEPSFVLGLLTLGILGVNSRSKNQS